ncbi:TIGR02281 family clan AA aspartic protease [Erythrobacteraceae bacterium CFH 75059]|uniref:retropepsin-like aspartic protease family protein n=1 Tax=Qipengyuania thermophila TaxID=2509361 RepID=UPI0010216301|nr:TIGR02281 family clan AA aspartic protease [Qipengyuania thermophila]TCD02242.1 TIGR02281 family clan AA aspartic protease [Erythrobacteraceae bacterium CFH 75059]
MARDLDLGRWLDRLDGIGSTELLIATFLAVVCGWLGTRLVRARVPFGGVLSFASTLALAGILLTVILQMAQVDPRMGLVRSGLGVERQVVEGDETRIRLSPDGHFWITADVNGERARFLVDTGATLTAVSADLAARAGLEPRQGGLPVRIVTANGAVAADLTRIDALAFGNIEARSIDAVIAPSLGQTNVLGMNFLSRLESWQVRDNTLILTPAARDVAEESDAGSEPV